MSTNTPTPAKADTTPELTPEILGDIRATALRMIGCCNLTMSDLEDLTQEMTYQVLARVPQYDPSRATFRTFARAVIANVKLRILRKRNRFHTAMMDSLDLPATEFRDEQEDSEASQKDLICDENALPVPDQVAIHALLESLDKISGTPKQVILLSLAGFKHREIHSLLAIPSNSYFTRTIPATRVLLESFYK